MRTPVVAEQRDYVQAVLAADGARAKLTTYADGLADDEVADLLWTTNAPEFYALAIARGWSPTTYAERLGDLWCRLLLADPLEAPAVASTG